MLRYIVRVVVGRSLPGSGLGARFSHAGGRFGRVVGWMVLGCFACGGCVDEPCCSGQRVLGA